MANKLIYGPNQTVGVPVVATGKSTPTNDGTLAYAQGVTLFDASGAPVTPASGLSVNEVGVAYAASGVTAVTGTFAATGQSATFSPLAGRDFNIRVGTPGASLSGSVQLERTFDEGANWVLCSFIDGTAMIWTTGVNTSWTESETGVDYRLNCTVYASNIIYRVSQ